MEDLGARSFTPLLKGVGESQCFEYTIFRNGLVKSNWHLPRLEIGCCKRRVGSSPTLSAMGFKNIETKREWYRNYYHKKMGLLRSIKGNECQFCGWCEVVEVLEFAHKKDSKKSFSIAHCLRKRKDEVEIEMEKCLLLCPTCHRIYDRKYV